MDDETLKILSMIESGKITAAQGAELLKAMGKEPPAKEATAGGAGESAAGGGSGRRPTVIGIYVTHEGKEKEVKVKVPVGLVDMIEKFLPKGVAAKMQAGGQDFDLGEVLRNVKSFAVGEILCVDTDDGKKVRICCE